MRSRVSRAQKPFKYSADPKIADSNWVLIQFRSRPVTGMMTSSPDDPDGRIEDVWFLIEESVPEDYRMDVAAGKVRINNFTRSCLLAEEYFQTKKSKRLSFLKPMRKKPVRSTGLASMNHLPPALPQAPLDDSVFSPGTGGTTRYLALDRPPSESMDRPMNLNLNQSFKLPPGKEPVSPISAGHGALPGTMTSQPSPKPQSDFPRSSTTEDRPDKSASNGLKRRSSSFEHIHARGVNLLGRMRTRRQRNQSISSMSDAGIEHRSGSPSITEFGASSGNGSWVNLMRRGTQNSRGSMDSNRVHMQQQQAQTFNSPAKGSAPAVHVRTPTVERDLPAVPIGSSAPSFVASSNEAVEELGGHPTSSRASMEEGELWRGSRYDTTSPDQIMEAPDEAEEEDFYRPERPRAPSPSSVNEQPLNTEDVPTIHSTDVTADHTTHVPPAPVQTPTKAPPVPEKTATSSPSTSGPHSERVAKLVAMYSNRDGKRGSAVQKKPVPALPVE